MTTTEIKTLTTYVPAADAERVQALAKASYRTVAAELRVAIRAHINANEFVEAANSRPDESRVAA